MKTLGTLLMLYSAVVLISSPLLYAWWSRNDWRNTRGGKHVMAYMAGLALVMCFALAGFVVRLTGHGALPDWVRPFVWLVIAFIGTWRLALLFQTRYRGE